MTAEEHPKPAEDEFEQFLQHLTLYQTTLGREECLLAPFDVKLLIAGDVVMDQRSLEENAPLFFDASLQKSTEEDP